MKKQLIHVCTPQEIWQRTNLAKLSMYNYVEIDCPTQIKICSDVHSGYKIWIEIG